MEERNERKGRRPRSAAASEGASAPAVPPNPASSLARAIAERLIERGLVSPDRRTEIASGLASGTLDADTWKLLAEVTLEIAARGRKS